jgi:hypothetical protein
VARLTRLLLGIGVLAAIVALAADRLLARRRGPNPFPPLVMVEVIDAPIERTWAVVADIPLQLEWMREMRSVTVTPGPTRVGTRGEATVRILGITVTDPVEVTAFEPPTRYAIRHEGLFTGRGVITLEPGADGTTTIIRWEETLLPPILADLGSTLQAPVLRAIFQADLRRLKSLVETGSVD